MRHFDCDKEQLDIFEYDHKSGLQSCEVQGGLFCIVKEGVRTEDDLKFYDFTKKAMIKNKWPEIFPTSSDRARIGLTYKINDFLMIYDEKLEKADFFMLPKSLTDSNCQIKEPVKFLKDEENFCM